MDKNTALDVVYRWSPEFGKGCFSTHEEHVCVSAGFYILSVLMLLVSCSLLLYHRCKTRCRTSGDEAACGLYCLVGNLCGAVGAFLSNQFAFQVSMSSYVAILDIIHILSITCSIYLWYRSKTGKSMRMISKRRRQNFLSVSLLFVVGGSVYLSSAAHLSPIGISPIRRRLLSLFLDDHIEDLGYVLGLLSFAINWTAKFPIFLKANRGEHGSALQVYSRVLCCLAGGLYTSSILFYDMQPRTVVKAMPWILTAICCALMDLAIVALVCYRSNHKRPSVRSLDSDTESLLGGTSAGQLCNNNAEFHRNKRCVPLARCISPKGTDMGLYMDVNIQPMRKVCLKEVTISRDCSSDALPLKRTVRVVRVDEPCSDSSSFSSELEIYDKGTGQDLSESEVVQNACSVYRRFGPLLCYFRSGSVAQLIHRGQRAVCGVFLKWDFEEPKHQWIPGEKAPKHLQGVEVFPLQEWQVGPVSKSSSRPGSHICHCNRAQLAENLVSKKPDDN